jgi:predicted peptidase
MKKYVMSRVAWLVVFVLLMSSVMPQISLANSPALNNLEVKVTLGGGGSLTPVFTPDTTAYTLNINSDIFGIAVLASVADPAAAKITVDGKPAESGAPTIVMPAVGESKVNVTVTAADGSSTTYTVTVIRENIQPIVEKFLKLSFTDPETGITMGYRLFVPENYDAAKSYPLVLFLHGAGELGNDNESQLTANQGATIWAKPEEQAKHPCFVLAPQSPKDPNADPNSTIQPFGKKGWTSLMANGPVVNGSATPFEPQPELQTAYHILQKVLGEYNIDKNRLYCMGLSMGGFGTWALGIAYPETFAALVPICGGGDPAKLATIANKPIWVYHAAGDPMIPVKCSQDSVKALKAAGGNPKYTEYAQDVFFFPMAHFSWVPAFADAEMRTWLFQQSK